MCDFGSDFREHAYVCCLCLCALHSFGNSALSCQNEHIFSRQSQKNKITKTHKPTNENILREPLQKQNNNSKLFPRPFLETVPKAVQIEKPKRAYSSNNENTKTCKPRSEHMFRRQFQENEKPLRAIPKALETVPKHKHTAVRDSLKALYFCALLDCFEEYARPMGLGTSVFVWDCLEKYAHICSC